MKRLALVVVVACGGGEPTPAAPQPIAVDVTPALSASTQVQPTPNAEPYVPCATPDANGDKPYTPTTKPFDPAAAIAALSRVPLQACNLPGGPTGPGHVTVIFEPAGNVASASIDSPPYAGTAVGQCLALVFSTAWAPPFAGPPARLGKTFNLP